MSERRDSTRSRVSWEKATLAWGSHAQWKGSDEGGGWGVSDKSWTNIEEIQILQLALVSFCCSLGIRKSLKARDVFVRLKSSKCFPNKILSISWNWP